MATEGRLVEVAGLEALVWDGVAGNPIVFVAHGRGGDHSGNEGLCRSLQKRGFTALSIEQRNHGKRTLSPIANAAWGLPDKLDNPSHAVDMYSQVVGTAHDCSMLIDALPAKYPELSMANGIGCCGISQGGHFALSLLVNEPRIDVAVALIGAGDYEQNMKVRLVPSTRSTVTPPPALRLTTADWVPARCATATCARPTRRRAATAPHGRRSGPWPPRRWSRSLTRSATSIASASVRACC